MDFAAARRIMVDSQIRPNDVTEPEIVSAFMKVAREAFVPASRKVVAYSETEIETSAGRALWPARDFSKLLKAAQPTKTDISLVIGAGAGYEAAILAELVETVIGLDDDEAVTNATTELLIAQGADRAVIVQGDLAAGLPEQGPFDLILINGMVQTIPDAWFAQLSQNGRLAVVVEEDFGFGTARIYTKSDDAVSFRSVFETTAPKFDAFDAKPSFSF